MTKTFWKRFTTCLVAAFICIGLFAPIDKAEAADYWTGGDGYAEHYLMTETIRYNVHGDYARAYQKNVMPDGRVIKIQHRFFQRNGEWYFSLVDSPNAIRPVSEAAECYQNELRIIQELEN